MNASNSNQSQLPLSIDPLTYILILEPLPSLHQMISLTSKVESS